MTAIVEAPATASAAAGAIVTGATLVKFVAAFALVMILMLGLAWVLRRLGLSGPMLRPGMKRRLTVLEATSLDPRRRLVIIKRDDTAHLLLLGPDHALVVERDIPLEAPVSPPSLSVLEEKEAGRACS